jgi:pectin methylesterase-like acyl-CoA thioesterase
METAMRKSLFALVLMAASALAQEPLKFDIAGLCQWQNSNNGMDLTECTDLETEAQIATATLEAKVDAARKALCSDEARNYSGDSGFASYTVYSECLRNGPGSL